MSTALQACRAWRQRGMALTTSLLLLVVVTILAVSMFRSFGIEGKIAGNVREKQRALLAAESAEQYGEWWLRQGSNSAVGSVICNTVLDANNGDGQICSNTLPSQFTNGIAGIGTGTWPGAYTEYTPPGMVDHLDPANIDSGSYYKRPRFYISDLGPNKDGSGAEVFEIDALGYGASPNTVAVVQSTFIVNQGVPCYSCSP